MQLDVQQIEHIVTRKEFLRGCLRSASVAMTAFPRTEFPYKRGTSLFFKGYAGLVHVTKDKPFQTISSSDRNS